MKCDFSYEDLAQYAAGELGAVTAAELAEHLAGCPQCTRRLAALTQADAALRALPPVAPAAEALLTCRHALAQELRRGPEPEVMTLDQVGAYLALEPAALAEIAGELPAFELAGQVRIRRSKLLEWIAQRERDYQRHQLTSRLSRDQASANAEEGIA